MSRVVIVPAFFSSPAIYKSSSLLLKEAKSLKKFIFGSYNYIDIRNVCPPFYDGGSKVVSLPLHESGSPASNQLIFSFLIAHEIVHAITRWLYGAGARQLPPEIVMTNGSFSYIEMEIITDVIAIKVLSKSIRLPKDIVHYVESLDWKSIFEIISKIMRVEGRFFLLQKQEKTLKNLPIKRLRGILEKHLGYKKQVKGLTRKQLIDIISKELSKRMEIIEEHGEGVELKIKLKEALRLKETARVLQKFRLFISDLDEERYFSKFLE